MRKTAKAFKVALAALLLAAGVAAAQDPEPVSGGHVVVAITAEPPGWDPSASTSQEIPRVVYDNVLQGLVRFDRTGEIVPALATSWETSEDGLTWTFHLREGVRFHDGSDFDAEDVVEKFTRAADPESGHTNSQYYEAIESVEAIDPLTVAFHLSRPSSSLLYDLARPDSVINPAGKADTQRTQPIGTGAFRFAEYVPGSHVRLERFEDYWEEGLPYLDSAEFRIISDANARFAALQAGDIDMIAVALLPEQFQQVLANPDLKGTQGSATAEITMALNNAREPLNDKRVRQAITHAIDKNAIVQGALFGLGTVIGTHMSPAENYYIDLTDTYPYDPERAKQLLAEAGYPNGFRVRFELPEPYAIERRTGEVIAQQLAQVGIEVELSVVEWATWLERIFLGGDYDMTIIGHSEPRDINVYANPSYYYHYDNPRIAELLAEAEAARTQEEATAKYQEIARIIAEDAVNVWVLSAPYLVAAKQDVYGFWTDQPTPSINLVRVYRAR